MKLLVSDLVPGTEYELQFRTDDGEAVSEWSPVYTVTTLAETDAPQTPTGVTWAVVTTSNTFAASWNAVTQTVNGNALKNLAYYEVVVDDNTGNTATFTTTELKFKFSRSDQIAAFGAAKAQLGFKVRAVDSVGEASAYSTRILSGKPVPAAPANFTATARTAGAFLDWDAVAEEDIAGYRIWAGTTSGFTPGPTNLVGVVTGTSFNFTTATFTTWYFKLVAFDSFGQESSIVTASSGVDSPFVVDTVAPKTPDAVQGTITTATDANLTTEALISWDHVFQNEDDTAITDLSGYRVQYRKNGDTSWTTTEVAPDQDSQTIRGLIPYIQYNFRVAAFDFVGNSSAYSSAITPTVPTNTAPSTPAAPTVSTSAMRIQVVVSGNKAAGGAMESDVEEYEVYASTTSGFATNPSVNMIGKVSVGPAMVETFMIPAEADGGANQTWYVKIIAVDRGGLKSAESAQATGIVGLIDTLNVAQASITDAHIQELSANKLIAGSGIITDLAIKSKLTILGFGASAGSIESQNFISGESGYRINTTGIELNEGTVKASALELQNGHNIMPISYADFEFHPSYYDDFFIPLEENNRFLGYGITTDEDKVYFNNQAMRIQSFLSAENIIPYNERMVLEPDTQYIFSFYAKDINNNTDYMMIMADWGLGEGQTPISDFIYVDDTGFRRESFVFTTPEIIGSTIGIGFTFLLINTPNLLDYPEPFEIVPGTDYGAVGLDVCLDGLQLEPKQTKSDGPSAWKAPSTTIISGGAINTGSIRSNAIEPMTGQPMWHVDLEGDAAFSNLLVRGTTIIGQYRPSDDETPVDDQSVIQSYNFESGVSGWQLKATGYSEFLQANISGEALITTGGIGERLNTQGYIDGAGIAQRTNINVDYNGKIVLSDGITPPAQAPNYEPYWKSITGEFNQEGDTGNGLFFYSGYWYTTVQYENANEIWRKADGSGNWSYHASINSASHNDKYNMTVTGGITRVGTHWYVGGYLHNFDNAIAYAIFDSSFNRVGTRLTIITNNQIIGKPRLGAWTTDSIVIAYCLKSDKRIYFQVAPTPTSGHDVWSPVKTFKSGIAPGQGVQSIVRDSVIDKAMVFLSGNNETLYKFENAANNTLASSEGGDKKYPAAYGYWAKGLAIDSGTYYTAAAGGNIYEYSNDQGTTANVCYSFDHTTGPKSTGVGPYRSITTTKGSWPRFSITADHPDVANQAVIYASTTTAWKKQATIAVPYNSVSMTTLLTPTTGTSPVSTKFTILNGGLIQTSSATIGETFELNGNGRGVWPLKMRAYEFTAPGGSLDSGEQYTHTLDFDPPFKSTPVIVVLPNDLAAPQNASVSVGSKSASSCNINVKRSGGYGNPVTCGVIVMEKDENYTRSGE